MSARRLDRGGFALHYEITGSGAETVVLTHGLASSGATWSLLVAVLAPRYRVVTWDMRAHGRSEAPDEPCPVTALGDDLAAVIAAAGGAPVHVLGHSAGGVVAMRCAIDRPELVRSAVLVGTSSECNARAAAFYESLAEVAERHGGAAAARRIGAPDAAIPPPDGRGFAHCARAMASLQRAPLTPELDGFRHPTLVIVGATDALGVGGSVIISRHIAGSRLAIVPERGHAIFREDPDGFARLVLEFLEEQRATRP